MVNANFTTSSARVNARIELTDIRQSTYDRIVSFITDAVNRERNAEGRPSIEPVRVMSEGSLPKKTVQTKKLIDSIKEQLSGIEDLYLSYVTDSNKAKYDLIYMRTEEFMEAFPEYKGMSMIGVGRKLSSMIKLYEDEVGPMKELLVKFSTGKSSGYARTYPIPVRKTTYGSLIQKARLDNQLNIKDFSNLIGYDVGVIKMWENDMATPSTEAIESIKKLVDSHAFDALEKTA